MVIKMRHHVFPILIECMSERRAYVKNFRNLVFLLEKGLGGMIDDHPVLKIVI